MKKAHIYLALSLAAIACSDDFLDLTPETQLSPNDFFKTEDQFQQALAGAYAPLHGFAGHTGWLMGEMRSDNTHYDRNTGNRALAFQYREHVADFTDDKENTHTSARYVNNYVGIARTNTILSRMQGAKLSEAAANSITGETRFLRALYYFDLVQYYGAVPLYLNEVTSPEDADLIRSPAADVYNAIISDLTDAIAKLPQTITFPQSGRVTLGAARTLLAHVYMVQKKYQEAEILLKQVTQMGYELLPDYGSVFRLNNKNSKESVFEVQFMMGNTGLHSNFIYYFIPRMSNTSPVTGVNSNNTSFSGGWNIPSPDLMNLYQPGDNRLDASVGVAEGVYDGSGNFVTESVKSVVGYSTPPEKVSKLFIKKYLNPHTTALQTADNWPVYRYADVLLLLAESLNEQNKPGEALPWLNQLRPRTGLPEITETNQAALRDIIADERRIELAFENKRWLDLVRTGKAISVMSAYGEMIKQFDPLIVANAYQVTDERLLFPIPLTEIQRNPGITQNPGY